MSQYNGKEKMMRVRQRDGLDAYLQAQQEIRAFTIEYYNFLKNNLFKNKH